MMVLGVIICIAGLRSPRSYVSAEATITAFANAEGINYVEPIVRFNLNGRKVDGRCQNVNIKKMDLHIGDSVKILYSTKEILGTDTLKVFLDDGRNPDGRDNLLRVCAGVMFFVVGIVLLILRERLFA